MTDLIRDAVALRIATECRDDLQTGADEPVRYATQAQRDTMRAANRLIAATVAVGLFLLLLAGLLAAERTANTAYEFEPPSAAN